MEIESAFIDYRGVAEAAAVAISHPIKGKVTSNCGFCDPQGWDQRSF